MAQPAGTLLFEGRIKPQVLLGNCPTRGRCLMRRGQTLTEYLLLVVLIAVVVIAALTVFGGGIGNRYANMLNQLPFP